MTTLSRTKKAERLWEALTSLKEYRRVLLEYHSLRLHDNDQSFESNFPLGDNDDEPYITVETTCDVHQLTIAEARTAAEHLETLADIAAAQQAAMGYAVE